MLKCSNADCQVNETGLCHEGVDPSADCPHLAHTEEVDEAAAALAQLLDAEDVAPRIIDIAGSAAVPRRAIGRGSEMAEEEADDLLRESIGVVVALMGMLDCGKTTMLAETFAALQRGPIGDLLFGGSSTLIAFDERCHKARLDSGNSTPHTPRTSQMALQTPYLHLDLCRQGEIRERHRLLIADISGETYEAASRQADVMRSLKFIKRADHLVAMFDGSRLADFRERAGAKRVMLNLLYRIRDTDMFHGNQTLHLVFTKWDEVVARDPETQTVSITNEIAAVVRESVGSQVGYVAVHHLAARSAHEAVENRFGLADLLRSWCPLRTAPKLPASDVLLADSPREITSFRASAEDANGTE